MRHSPHVLALAIVAAITIVLVWGIRETASFNFWMVGLKLLVLGFFVIVSFKFVKPENWTPFAPNGMTGILSGAAVVFFAYIGFDAVSTTAEEARNPKRDMPIGIIGSLIICTIIYAIPRTSVLGAILLTGYLGGATATHVRVGDSLFPILFPGLMGALIWGGLYLRDGRLRELLPLRK